MLPAKVPVVVIKDVKQPASIPESSITDRGDDSSDSSSDFHPKGIWRESQLATPRKPRKKYVRPDGRVKLIQKSIEINPEILARCDQLALAPLRTVKENKRSFRGILNKHRMKNLMGHEEKILESIYYRYRKQQMIEERRRMRRELHKIHMAKSSRKMVKETDEQRKIRLNRLALPARVFDPDPVDRGDPKPLTAFHRTADLARPPRRDQLPPRSFEVSEAAKRYIPNDIILRLAEQPARYDFILPPLAPDRPVTRSALTYNITPGVAKLYVVKIRKEAPKADIREEGWTINPYALTYTATPRIIELAQPVKR